MSPLFRLVSMALLSLPVLAQVPAGPDAAFFSREPSSLAKLCSAEGSRLRAKGPCQHAIHGHVQLALGERPAAEAAFAQAIALNPDDADSRRLIARAWLRQGFRPEALKAYEAMISIDLAGQNQKQKNLLLRAALDLVEVGEVKVAAGYMERSYQQDKSDSSNFLEFGRAALLAGEGDLAALYFARAAKADPKDVDVWLEITNAHAELLLRKARRPAAK